MLMIQLENIIPEYSGCDILQNECRETRLIKDLLTHTAGYTPECSVLQSKKSFHQIYTHKIRYKTEQIIETKLKFERPRGGGQIPVYSDIDYMLLGLVVEHISGNAS